MEQNAVMSTVMGTVIFAVIGGVGWALKFGLELGYATMGKSLGYLLAAPMVLFIAYLIGNGYLENKAKLRSK